MGIGEMQLYLDQVLASLPIGEENGVPLEVLCEYFNVSENDLRNLSRNRKQDRYPGHMHLSREVIDPSDGMLTIKKPACMWREIFHGESYNPSVQFIDCDVYRTINDIGQNIIKGDVPVVLYNFHYMLRDALNVFKYPIVHIDSGSGNRSISDLIGLINDNIERGDIFECQQLLIDKGYDEYARM